MGERGFNGTSGIPGEMGERGFNGTPGEKGNTGPQGTHVLVQGDVVCACMSIMVAHIHIVLVLVFYLNTVGSE